MGNNIEALSEFFKGLSDTTRLFILSLLSERPLCVCEISGALGITQTKTSRHLIYLKNRGFVTSSREDRWVVYELSNELSGEERELVERVVRMVKSLPEYKKVKERLEAIIADSGYRDKFGKPVE